MNSKLVAGVVVTVLIVSGAYVLSTRSLAGESEKNPIAPQKLDEENEPNLKSKPKYELFYNYEAGEYYTYSTDSTSTIIRDNTQRETSSSSTHSIQITEIEGDKIGLRNKTTLWGDVDVTLNLAATNKGRTLSWEIENVMPRKQWDNVARYEETQMAYSQLIEDLVTLPSGPVSIDEKWNESISSEVPWGPELSISLKGGGTAHFLGEEKIKVEAGTFNCWRINYTGTVSGEEKDDSDHKITLNWTIGENVWYNRRNCAMIKSTSSYKIDWKVDDHYAGEQISNSVVKLVDCGMIAEEKEQNPLNNGVDLTFEPDTLQLDDPYSIYASATNGESKTMNISEAVLRVYLENQLFDESLLTSELDNTIPSGKTEQIWERMGNFTGDVGEYRIEIYLVTNYGTLEDSTTFTVRE